MARIFCTFVSNSFWDVPVTRNSSLVLSVWNRENETFWPSGMLQMVSATDSEAGHLGTSLGYPWDIVVSSPFTQLSSFTLIFVGIVEHQFWFQYPLPPTQRKHCLFCFCRKFSTCCSFTHHRWLNYVRKVNDGWNPVPLIQCGKTTFKNRNNLKTMTIRKCFFIIFLSLI